MQLAISYATIKYQAANDLNMPHSYRVTRNPTSFFVHSVNVTRLKL